MKYALVLVFILATVWFIWSGHTAPFMLMLGGLSCLIVLWFCGRMGILDPEGVPLHLGLGPLIYAPWLIKEVFKANLNVARRILSRPLQIDPSVADVPARQKTEVGRVIFANSITLTPGTVSLDIQNGTIRVYWLAWQPDALAGMDEMGRRVCRAEGSA